MISVFVRRPIATTLLAIGLALAGIGALGLLPVAPMPNIDIPTINVSAQLPGASPETMSSSVATPLERHLGAIPYVTEMTSRSSLGSTNVTLQFDISRDIDGALRGVQAAIQAAMVDLPSSMRNPPRARKFNPASQPILSLALTSATLTPAQIFDQASNILQQRLSQVPGVGDATPQGASAPAVRVELNPRAVFKYGINLNSISNAIRSANGGSTSPKGDIQQGNQRIQIYSNDNASSADDFRNLVIAYRNGSAVRLSDVATVYDGQEQVRNLGVANGKPAVLINVTQQPGSNVIQVVDRIKAILPELQKSLPQAIDPIVVVQDPTVSIRNSVRDVEVTLILSTILVVLVVFLFLRNVCATLVPAVSVPLALLGTFGGMYLMGYSLNNFSLMALIISTGFVVDNAIVVLENVTRHLEAGRSRLEAAMVGTSEVAFTVISMSISLVAVFIPILLMPGIVGKIFHEFAMVLTIAILVSLVVSLTVTPMMCAYINAADTGTENWFMRGARRTFEVSLAFYRRTLAWSLDNPKTIMATLFVAIFLNVYLYTILPAGFFPQTDEGRMFGSIRGDQTMSFDAMKPKFLKFMEIIQADPAVKTVAGSLGGGGFGPGGGANGNLQITLKPRAERDYVTSEEVRTRLMPKFADIAGARAFINSASSVQVRAGGGGGSGNYQYTVQGDTIEDLKTWVPKIQDALYGVPEIDFVDPDQQPGGLEMQLNIDRETASRMGLATNQISGTLQNSFSEAAVSTIYKDKNQYRVIMEVAPSFWISPDSLKNVYVSTSGNISGSQATAGSVSGNVATSGAGTTDPSAAQAAAEAVRNQQQNSLSSRGAGSTSAAVSTRVEKMVPLSAFVTMGPGTAPLSVNHQDGFVATSFSYSVPEGVSVGQATAAINRVMEQIHVPISVHGGFIGTARLAQTSMAAIPMLILAAMVIIYIVLGMLYESYIHPLTIISTLPSAGVGALLALLLFRIEFSLIAFIGVMLLIGVVKKNAIIMIDFAISLQRAENLTPREAIYLGSVMRFRPIMMTTMGAILGALPLAIGVGEGYELRQPLGVSIVGGLIVSQILTLYTTPVIYMYLDRFGSWCGRNWNKLYGSLVGHEPAATPAE